MLVDSTNLQALTAYLQNRGLLAAHDFVIRAEKPGEGNMNYTLRLIFNERESLICKQARPYVEKYPSIPAPQERILVEGNFYATLSENDAIAAYMPAIIHLDSENYILLLEDIGQANDLSYLYQKGETLSTDDAASLGAYLHILHSQFKETHTSDLSANRTLRALNHEHIFVYPLLLENGFNLDDIQAGLQELALVYKNDEALKAKAETLGAEYLADGTTLLHGDYYPGSFLASEKGLQVIDPEFSFYGFLEFDLAVLVAHLKLAQQSKTVLNSVLKAYNKPASFNENRFNAFVGIEIMRRLIGLAQLPLALNLNEKEALLHEAYELIMA